MNKCLIVKSQVRISITFRAKKYNCTNHEIKKSWEKFLHNKSDIQKEHKSPLKDFCRIETYGGEEQKFGQTSTFSIIEAICHFGGLSATSRKATGKENR